MIDFDSIKTKVNIRPPKIILYGPPGIGKSTWAAQAPKPIFLDIEKGLDVIEVPRVEINKFSDFSETLSLLIEKEHEFKTIVIDSLDWLEKIIHAQICLEQGAKTLMSIPYGNGYQLASLEWKKILERLDVLRLKKNMMIIMLAHVAVKKFEDPTTDAYDQYSLKLHKSGADIVSEYSDCIFFATQKIYTQKRSGGFGKEIIKPKTSDERIFFTTQSPSFIAKNRYGLPVSLPLNFDAFRQAFVQSTNKRSASKEVDQSKKTNLEDLFTEAEKKLLTEAEEKLLRDIEAA